MTKSQVGMIGLGTMGRNLLLNIADHGFIISGYDKDIAKQATLNQINHKNVIVSTSIESFVHSLETPRKIIILVPAGKIVDYVIQELIPFLEKDDILIDGGNSHFTDTDRRFADLQSTGIHFMGMGVSGGEDGARYGPSMMPGSNRASYEVMRPILEKIAAKAEGMPCVQFIGNGAAGHYTKMVHNGIEYAMMQMISEVYGVLKALGYTNNELHEFFKECNQSLLKGYLIEITSAIFLKKDNLTDADLVDVILDKAGQKGTGMWTSQSAFDLMVPITIIDSAVSARNISALKAERVNNSKSIGIPKGRIEINADKIKETAMESLYLGFMLCYTQGLHLLQVASLKYGYQLQISNILDVWKGGCIIRSDMLGLFKTAYEKKPLLINAFASSIIYNEISVRLTELKELVAIGIQLGIATPALSNALNYCIAYSTEHLPANLIQAQRDYFGAHTYERNDREGIFHTDWNN